MTLRCIQISAISFVSKVKIVIKREKGIKLVESVMNIVEYSIMHHENLVNIEKSQMVE